ncbi:ribosome assembly protein Sqt1p [Trichomonascus vanleenenianus]|uniref:Sqt1p n=1 Tax=Trichomonascus vanleenenianus TaxID=2268995 RepID=UPI003ECA6F99
MSEQEQSGGIPEEEFIEEDQIAQIVPEDDSKGEPFSDDEDTEMKGPDDEDVLEVDMSNNSSSYFDMHNDSVFLVASHPTLPMVVSGGADDTGYLWTTHKFPATLVTKLSGHTESVVAGGFTPSGDFVVTGDMSGQIRVWRSTKKGEVWQFHDSVKEVEEIVWIRFHPTQNIFAAGASDGTVWCYALEPNLANISVLNSHAGVNSDGVFVDTENMDVLTLVTISEDSTIVSWNVYMGKANYTLGRAELKGEHPWISLAPSPSERTFAAGSQDGTVVIVNTSTGALLDKLDTTKPGVDEFGRSVEAIAWSMTAKILAVGNVEGQVQFFDIHTWKVRRTITLGDAITKMVFIDKSPILVVSANDGTMAKYDARSGERIWQGLGHNAGVLSFALQNEGQRIITAGDEGVCLVFNDDNNQLLK